MASVENLEAVLAYLSDERTRVRVVIIDELPGSGAERVYDTYRLELTRRLAERFRTNIAATLHGWPKPEEWEPYDPSFVPDEGVVATAGAQVLDGSPLLAAIDAALAANDVRLPRPGERAEGGVHGYAVIFTPPSAGRIVAFRRLDPVERLGRGRITAFLLEHRLTDAEVTLGFDSGVDVLLSEETALIRHLAALEALFFPAAVRAEAAVRVVDALSKRINIGNLADLIGVAQSDSVFGGRLRRLAKSDALATVTIAAVRKSLTEFGWRHRFLVGNELRFDPTGRWRWPFLAALEDGLTESVGSGRLYRANSQRHWPRRMVTAVGRGHGGTIVNLCGDDWGPVGVEDAVDHINNIVASYFVQHQAAHVEVVPAADGSATTVHAADENGADLLGELPECDP